MELDAYNIIKSFGQCFDAGTVLLATRRNLGPADETYLAVRKYTCDAIIWYDTSQLNF